MGGPGVLVGEDDVEIGVECWSRVLPLEYRQNLAIYVLFLP